MFRTQIQYYGDTLCVYLSGIASYQDIEKVKDKIRTIIREYGIRKLQIEINSNCNVNIGDFDEFKSNLNYYYSDSFEKDIEYFEKVRA